MRGWALSHADATCGSCNRTIDKGTALRRVASGVRCGNCAREMFGEVPCFDVVSNYADEIERPWLKWAYHGDWKAPNFEWKPLERPERASEQAERA